MKQTLHIEMDVELFSLEDVVKAEDLARQSSGRIYTWKTIGRSNWLEYGLSQVNALGLVVLPSSLPYAIDMCPDEEE